MTTSTATWLAWYMCVLSLVLTALSLFLLILNQSHPSGHIFDYWAEDTTIAVVSSIVGAVIASHSPQNHIGWIFCAIGFVGAVDHLSAQYATYSLLAAPGSLPGGESLAWIRSWIWVLHLGLFIFLGLLFPDGRLPSSRWRWFAWLSTTIVLTGAALVAISPGPIDGLGPIRNPQGIEGAANLTRPVEAILFALVLIAATSLFVRLRHARGIERLQLKWFAYAAAVASTGGTLTYTISRMVSTSWAWGVGYILLMVGLVGLPIAVGIAVLRYRLYNIDLIINRTLVYGLLTVTLGLVYFGSVLILNELIDALTGENSQLVIVASTLAIAALFSPLRRYFQSFIDRRFYRRKYDAAKTLERFGTRLREETDLERLCEDLEVVVRETMQPAHVSLWLHPIYRPQSEASPPSDPGR